jgi:hypothetical protein
MTKEELKKKIEEALVPCAACCLDDERDHKRVVDALVRALHPLVEGKEQAR